ncbi:MAG: hypothetical protein IJ249_01395 [Paludibacteraceae bacterium]|nr:hypothetical protein [Paludibacteraceae bacterium]
MKKNYIIPSTESIAFRTASLCDTAVASANGPFNYGGSGGDSTPIDPV